MMSSPAVPHVSTTDDASPNSEEAAARRALLVSDGEAAPELKERLTAAGFSVARSSVREAFVAAQAETVSVVFLIFEARDGDSALVNLARRLRANPSTFSLPVVFLFREDERAIRSAAQHFGADDYFSQDAPADEIRARLASLFWRIEASRRTAPALAEQRDEIDNFIFLLDAITCDLAEGIKGAVALFEAEGRDPSSLLREAHAFLKLNLRRVDAVAFYGPTTLIAYLPNATAASARATLTRLREEFRAGREGADLFAGIAAFPRDGEEVETLVERAELALRAGREANRTVRIVVYGEESADGSALSTVAPDVETRQGTGGARRTTDATAGSSGIRTGARHDDARTVNREDAASEPVRESAQVQRPEEFRPRRSTLRRLMLVISDAARMAQVNLLMRSASYEVRAAFDGHHALNLLRIDTPDLLLLDYALHGMDGVEMLRRLAQQSGAGRLPATVLLVPEGLEDIKRDALKAGAHSVVWLPYDPVELLETLRAADASDG